MSEWMGEFVKFVVVAEVIFAISVSLTTPFLPKIMQHYEKKKMNPIKIVKHEKA